MAPKMTGSSARRLRAAVLILAVMAALFVVALAMAADGVTIGRYLTAGGGGRVTAGDLALSGSAGQAVAGPVSAGNLTLSAGFWRPQVATETATATATGTTTVTATATPTGTPGAPTMYLPEVNH